MENVDQQIVDFDIIARRQALNTKIVNTPITGISDAPHDDKSDLVISDVARSGKREQNRTYAPTYFASRQLVARPKNSKASSLRDRASKKIAMVNTSTVDAITSHELGKSTPTSGDSRPCRSSFSNFPTMASPPAARRVTQNPDLKALDNKSSPEEGFGMKNANS